MRGKARRKNGRKGRNGVRRRSRETGETRKKCKWEGKIGNNWGAQIGEQERRTGRIEVVRWERITVIMKVWN